MDFEDRIKKSQKAVPSLKLRAGEVYQKAKDYKVPNLPFVRFKPAIILTGSIVLASAAGTGLYFGLRKQNSPEEVTKLDLTDCVINDFSKMNSIGIVSKKDTSAGSVASTRAGVKKRAIFTPLPYQSLNPSSLPFTLIGLDQNNQYNDLTFSKKGTGEAGKEQKAAYSVLCFANYSSFFAIAMVDTLASSSTTLASSEGGSAASSDSYYCFCTDATLPLCGVNQAGFFIRNNCYFISKANGNIYRYSDQIAEIVSNIVYDYQGGLYCECSFKPAGPVSNDSNVSISNGGFFITRFSETEDHSALKIEKLFSEEASAAVGGVSHSDKYGTLLVGNNLFTLDNRTVPIPDLPDGTKVTFTNPFDFYDIFSHVFKAIGNDNKLYCLDQNQQWVAHGEVLSTGFSPITLTTWGLLYLNTAEDGSIYFISSESSTGNADPAIWKTTFEDEFRYSVTKVCSLEDYDYESYDYTIVTRGSCLYYYGKNGGIYKADELAGTVQQLTFPNYSVKSLSEDGLGNIVVKGFDDNLQPFTGYLDGNDQITFDVQASDYQVILVSPINR